MADSRRAVWLKALVSWMERLGTSLEGLAPTHWGC